ncbi:DNA methyltransferase [Mycobacterium phage Lamina13]|uniref:DNA methyltransferase n=1 Tax=Mycobacterium phage Lamina13 TaxID=1468169 RepID=UPI00043B1B7F|nr:DNA methyltransferase [Mycobacterium phage Lamina13]AHN84485.1 DNA methylase [Mycobacterium phage Lamina13]AXH66015.1 DNA methylase [Mycobacterium phage Pita2]WAB08932.1 DNA methyltransferase [Mycobacterium phage Tote]WNM68096.1 DNA methyltransferase [Mycobacterium phage JuliaChild]
MKVVGLGQGIPDPFLETPEVVLIQGDALQSMEAMADQSIDCVSTSPPYFGLRDYGVRGQYGSEASPAEYVSRLVRLFSEVFRVLSDEGTLWLNIGDSYRDKNLLGIPWKVAFALQDSGWILRNDIIWHKTNAMPFSGKDRLSNRFEHVFLFTKKKKYVFDLDSVREKCVSTPDRNGRNALRGQKSLRASGPNSGQYGEYKNPGDVWSISTRPFPEAHLAVQSPELAERCVRAGSRAGGIVLDPFSGTGTTGAAALKHGRKYVGIDLNREYLDLSVRTRLAPYLIRNER